MKKLMILLFIIIVVLEVMVMSDCYVTAKYQLEEATNPIYFLRIAYSLLDTLSMLVIFNLVYLLVMHIILFYKKC